MGGGARRRRRRELGGGRIDAAARRLGATRRAVSTTVGSTSARPPACAAPPSCGSARGAARAGSGRRGSGRDPCGRWRLGGDLAGWPATRIVGAKLPVSTPPASTPKPPRFGGTVTPARARGGAAGGRRTPRAARRCSVAVRRGGSRVPSRWPRGSAPTARKSSWISSGTSSCTARAVAGGGGEPAAGRTPPRRAHTGRSTGPGAAAPPRRTARSERSWASGMAVKVCVWSPMARARRRSRAARAARRAAAGCCRARCRGGRRLPGAAARAHRESGDHRADPGFGRRFGHRAANVAQRAALQVGITM